VLTANNACQTSATANSNAIQLTVKPSPSVSPITNGISTINAATLCALGGTSSYYSATGYGVWTSSNPSVASVSSASQKGVVTANTNGTTTLTYSVTSVGCVSTSSVALTVAAITPNAISGINSICANATTTLSCTAPAGTTGVWSSLNDRGIISASGVYTGKNAGAGQARYTVTNSNGCTSFSNYSITVNAIPAAPAIGFAAGTVNPQAGAPTGSFCANRTFSLVALPAGGGWSSTASGGAAFSVSPTGVVTTGAFAGSGSVKYTYTSAGGCSNSKTLSGNVVVCAARGVTTNDKLETTNEFTMYPNPAKGFINLNVETLVGTGSIVITDLYGKTVKTQVLSMGTNTVNTANLSKGFYLVSVITSEGKNTKKLIVE
jgi:hypothetical protein